MKICICVYSRPQIDPTMHLPLPLLLVCCCLLQGIAGQNILDIFRSSSQVNENIIKEPSSKGYDFIVVGAGSGGSAVANRLSENGKWRVLLMEAGPAEGFLNQIPVLVSFFQLTDFNWGYKVEPQTRACLGMKNRQCPWPRGKCLGGTSTLNYMIHTRGNKRDYEIWAALGNEGWSYQDVLPYYKKSERFKVPGEFFSNGVCSAGSNWVVSHEKHCLVMNRILRVLKIVEITLTSLKMFPIFNCVFLFLFYFFSCRKCKTHNLLQ